MGTYRHLVRSESATPATRVAVSNMCSGGFFGLGMFVAHGFSIGQTIKLTGFVADPTINGLHTVTSTPSSSEFVIDVACSTVVGESGFVQLYDESTFTEVYPLGFTESGFDYKKEKDRVYFKRTFSGEFTFINRIADGIYDYTYFIDIENTDACQKIEYQLQKKCDGVYGEYWSAYFSVTDGEWDKDKCIFKIKPIPDDNFDCMEAEVDLNILITSPVTTYYNAPDVADRNYENTRLLSDVLDFLASQTCSRINGVVSDFFQINPQNSNPINYVTGEVNPYTQITIGMKVDLKEPTPGALATSGIISFKELMRILNTLFNVYWTIDESNNVRIEHISYFSSQPGIDLTVSQYDKWTLNTNKYSYNKEDVPSEENWTVDESAEIARILYDNYCTNTLRNNSKKQYNTGKLTTNIILLRANSDSIKSDEGFVIMATAYNAGTGKYDVLSWANDALNLFTLILKFFRYNRSSLSGGLFNYGPLFIYSEKKTKAQKEFVIPLCCDDNFIPSHYFITALGNGNVQEAFFNIKRDTLRLNLAYGSSDQSDIIPSDLGNLSLWLKGDDANTAGPISSWTDQSGNGRNATQATSGKRPVKVLNTLNGLPVLRFDGTDDELETASFQTFPSKRGSLFIVFKCFQPLNNNIDTLLDWSTSAIEVVYDDTSGPSGTPATTLNRKYIGEGVGEELINARIGEDKIDISSGYKVSSYGYTDFVLFEYIRDTDISVSSFGNGVRQQSRSLSNPAQPASVPFHIARGGDFKGDIAEIILYDVALSTYDRQRIELYLIKKYALFPYS